LCRLGENAFEKRVLRNGVRVFLLALFHSRNEVAVVDIVTRLQAEQLRDCDSIRGRGKSLLYFPQRHDRFWGSTQSPIELVPGAFFPGVRRLAREIEHSFPYNAEVENARSYTTTPPICFHRVLSLLPLSFLPSLQKHMRLIYYELSVNVHVGTGKAVPSFLLCPLTFMISNEKTVFRLSCFFA